MAKATASVLLLACQLFGRLFYQGDDTRSADGHNILAWEYFGTFFIHDVRNLARMQARAPLIAVARCGS
jgi:hypothetical protein